MLWLVADVARFHHNDRGIWKLLMPCEQKQTQNAKKNFISFFNFFKFFIKKLFALKLNKILKWATKNIPTVNFIIPKSKKRQRNASRPGWNFDKVENLLIWKNFANYKDWSLQLQLSRISFQSWDIWTLHNDIFANQEYQLR